MKTQSEIDNKLMNMRATMPSKFPGSTWEQGVEEALMWVLGDIEDDDFDSE